MPAATRYILTVLVFVFFFIISTAQDTMHIRTLVNDMFAPGSLYIGTAMHNTYLGTETETIVSEEYSYLTPANEFKQSYIHPEPGYWKWINPDKMVEFARENDQVIRIHGPISPQCSSWAKDDNRTAEELEQNLEEYVSELCKRYNDCTHIQWLDVVNEIFNRDGTWFGPKPGTDSWENPWPLIGYDTTHPLNPPIYIKKAFEIADSLAPDLKLIINQHGFEQEMLENMKELVYYLRDQGIRIDGLGWQAHNDLGWESEPGNLERLGEFIDWCHNNDLEFHITEFNVWLRSGDELKWEEQADSFYEIVKVAASRQNTGVVGINFWHIRGVETQNKDRDGGLWADDYHPKQAYYHVKKALYEIKKGIGPEISSTPPASALIGQEYSYSPTLIAKVGEVSYSLGTEPEASWLNIDSFGNISGTPTIADTTIVTLTVTDDVGARTQQYTLISFPEELSITSEAITTATVTFNYEYALEYTGTGSFQVSAEPEAAWLSISKEGLLSGIPDQEGQHLVTVSLTRHDHTVYQVFNLSVAEALEITSSAKTTATEGLPYRYQVGYKGQASFSVECTPDAPWLTISSSGALTGTPPASDTIHIKITAVNEMSTVSQEFDLEIAKKLVISSSPPKTAFTGQLYQYQVIYSGIGTFELETNKESNWLSIDQNGLLSGTPENPDTIQVRIKFKNDAELTNQVFTLIILKDVGNEAPALEGILIYPNPASKKLNINGIPHGSHIQLFSISGRLVYSEIAKTTHSEINLAGLAKGSYLLNLSLPKQFQNKLILVY